tara:strand:+ start:96 stop:533 length:438 start_codon:yes stop_codon:yes gene_type:complete
MTTAAPSPINYTCDTSQWLTRYPKDTVSTMNAIFQGCSPMNSFKIKSTNYGLIWSGSSQFGAIVGFALFGIMYLFTIVSIIIDIFKRQAEYEAEVEADKTKLTELGIDVLSLDAELQKRLNVTEVVANADDQLLGEASKLTVGQY